MSIGKSNEEDKNIGEVAHETTEFEKKVYANNRTMKGEITEV